MGFPQVKATNVKSLLNREDIIKETAQQIMKDFGMFGLTITFSGNIEDAYEELHKQLIAQIETLLINDRSKLLSVLYQVDIPETAIKKTSVEFPHYSENEVIGHQIIVRDLQKVLTRHYFKAGS